MTTSRISQLKSIISLEEQRASLLGKLDALDEKIARLQRELYGAGKQARRAATKAPRVPEVVVSGRSRRGGLKEHILEVLAAAGPHGITVREIASHLGIKPANIHSWFSANTKKISGLKKVGTSRFALTGGAATALTSKAKAEPEAKTAASKARTAAAKAKPAGKTTATAGKTKAATGKAKAAAGKSRASAGKAKAAKAAPRKEAKKATAAKAPAIRAPRGSALTREPARRGELKNRILAELKKAGDAGITIKDLSTKTKTKYKNLYIWFVTTGKRIPGIEKVGPACYRLKGTADKAA